VRVAGERASGREFVIVTSKIKITTSTSSNKTATAALATLGS
jgi:hypothetical protein